MEKDILIVRVEQPLDEKTLEEVRRKTGVRNVLYIPKLEISYEMPIFLLKKGIQNILKRFLGGGILN